MELRDVLEKLQKMPFLTCKLKNLLPPWDIKCPGSTGCLRRKEAGTFLESGRGCPSPVSFLLSNLLPFLFKKNQLCLKHLLLGG